MLAASQQTRKAAGRIFAAHHRDKGWAASGPASVAQHKDKEQEAGRVERAPFTSRQSHRTSFGDPAQRHRCIKNTIIVQGAGQHARTHARMHARMRAHTHKHTDTCASTQYSFPVTISFKLSFLIAQCHCEISGFIKILHQNCFSTAEVTSTTPKLVRVRGAQGQGLNRQDPRY